VPDSESEGERRRYLLESRESHRFTLDNNRPGKRVRDAGLHSRDFPSLVITGEERTKEAN